MKTTLSKFFLTLILASFCHRICYSQQNAIPGGDSTNSILMVVSSYGKDGGKVRPGYEFDEFSQAYLIFKDNGYLIDVAAPLAGAVTPDEFNAHKPYNRLTSADTAAMALLKNTKSTAAIHAEDYAAVYIVGGKGAMFDLPYDVALQEFLANFYAREGTVIGAVCHGPAALVNIKNDSNEYIIDGHRMTGFSNKEEEMFGKKWVEEFPFMLEDKLRSRNVHYEHAPVMLPYVISSGKIITGQNPYSTNALATEMVKALGKTPKHRDLYADEQSMLLVKKAIEGDYGWAKNELASSQEKYDVELIAVYGYYGLLDKAADNQAIAKALRITELARPYMFNEHLFLEMAKGRLKLQEQAEAKILLEEILEQKPDFEGAKKILETL